MEAVGPDATVAEVALALDGDADAFARIVSEHHEDVLRVCFLVCGSRDTAEDAAQSTWAPAWLRLKTLRDPTRLRAWVLAIAANEARQQVRRERLRLLLPIRSSVALPDVKPTDLDLDAALRLLSSDDRRLLALRHVGGLSSTEIGALLHRSPAAIRMRLSRLHERLRKELGDD
jgi:RNA polymerase sigma-70 factor (ECF subfamily)